MTFGGFEAKFCGNTATGRSTISEVAGDIVYHNSFVTNYLVIGGNCMLSNYLLC